MATYEMHIAIPVVTRVVMEVIFRGLAEVGFTKNKFFYKVNNVRPEDASCHSAGTPPVGHDLAHPGAMSTVKVESYEEGRRLLLAGMNVLARHGVHGNFEIEGLIGPTTHEFPAVALEQDFPGFRATPDSPVFENHIIWKLPASQLPSMDQIVRFCELEMDVAPHQIVDFGRDWYEMPETVVSRVATVYQPSRAAVARFAELLPGANNTRLPYRYAVGEQVLLVGEPC